MGIVILRKECVRSTYGEIRDTPVGRGSPWSRKIRRSERQRPPLTKSPAITMVFGSLVKR